MGESGRDTLLGGAGADNLWGGSDDDVLDAGSGDDLLQGGNGRDELWAGAGNDRLYGGNDSDLLAAGAGNDVIDAGNGDDFMVGGKGEDILYAGYGNDVIAFNRGDGADTLSNQNGDHDDDHDDDHDRDTLSLGGGIRYADITLSKVGGDLILGLGQGDQIALKDWYDGRGGQNKTIAGLQLVTDAAGGDYNPAAADAWLNRKVQVFDFHELVHRFDRARSSDASLTTWAAELSLRSAYLSGSNTKTIGGDLAYRYAALNDENPQVISYGDFDWKSVENQMDGRVGDSRSRTTSSIPSVNPWTALQAGTSLILEEPTGASLPINLRPALSQDELVTLAMNTQQQLTGQNRPSWS
jgi:hypothetical protein